MELLTPKKYSVLAAEKIAGELKDFNGNQYGRAVKDFVASTLTNFCEQSEKFAEVGGRKMSEIKKPAPDSHFRLLPCDRCKSEDVVYVQMSTGGKSQYRVRCRFCGNRTLVRDCKHDAQIEWNERCGRVKGVTI